MRLSIGGVSDEQERLMSGNNVDKNSPPITGESVAVGKLKDAPTSNEPRTAVRDLRMIAHDAGVRAVATALEDEAA